jgi:MYXO-CTERM domain-containing protein
MVYLHAWKRVGCLGLLALGAVSAQAQVSWDWALDTTGTGVSGEFFSNNGGTFLDDGNGPYQMQVIDVAGVTLFDNIGASTDGSDPVDPTVPLGDGPLFDSFSVHTPTDIISNVSLKMVNPVPMGGNFTVFLLSDTGFIQPGTVLAQHTFSQSVIGTTDTILNVSFGPQQLTQGRYWIGVSTTPEPAPFAVLGLGAVALLRRRKKA